MAISKDERHRYGQHYTPRDVARLLAAFAVRAENDLVFDPSCGDGRLLAEALRLKREFAPRRLQSNNAGDLYGADRSKQAIELAAETGAQVAVADFFNIAPAATLNESIILPAAFDAIIGNPPYIRQELMASADKQRIARRMKLDSAASDDLYWPRWSGRSDIYVYFFAHAASFLKPGGRLVFLTASSWLDVGYGAALREFMLANFRVIAIIESSCESFFEDASINTAITVLEREPSAIARSENPIRFVRLSKRLSIGSSYSASKAKRVSGPRLLAKEIECASRSVTTDAYQIRVVEQASLIAATPSHTASTSNAACRGGPPRPPLVANTASSAARGGHGGPPLQGWGKFLRADEVFFQVLERGGARLQPLSKLARVRFGVKTGANEFFYVKEEEQGAKGKGQGDKSKQQSSLRALGEIASVRRGLTTGANEFFYLPQNGNGDSSCPTPNSHPPSPIIEPRYLSPVIFSLKEIPGIVLDRSHTKRLCFNCQLSSNELTGTGALDYIRQGERAGFHLRPTCSSREPWYGVAREMKPAPLIFPSKVGERWVVALNRAGVFEDKKLYGIFPAEGVSELVLAALLNSTWARYYAEITCRQMTGAQAIADIDVAVAGEIMIPDPRRLSTSMKMNLEAAVVELSRRPVLSVFEEVRREDRRRLDDLTLQATGFSEGSTRKRALDDLYEAVTRLVRSRLSKVFDIRAISHLTRMQL
jgi:methylase of polypeptide subunit release factors